MPFPIQRIQTDRGLEFFAIKFQEKLKQYATKFRPIKPRSPHLNGKVERSQRTDLEEFYPTVSLQDSELHQKLADWQDYYNEFRPHGSLDSKTPWEKWNELVIKTPYHDEVEAAFDESKERIRLQNYKDDLYWQKLKLSSTGIDFRKCDFYNRNACFSVTEQLFERKTPGRSIHLPGVFLFERKFTLSRFTVENRIKMRFSIADYG